MKAFTKIPIFALGAFYALTTNAQDIPIPDMYPEYVNLTDVLPPFKTGSVILTDKEGRYALSANTLLKNVQVDQIGMEHYRYQQNYLGIPVEYAIYIMHVKDNKVMSQNGVWVKHFPASLNASPSLSATDALNKAMHFIGAKTYKWQIPSEEAFLKQEQDDKNATFYPKADLVFYGGEDEVTPSALRLAYKLDIYAHAPISRKIVYVDANNGKILGEKELLHNVNATGEAYTAYSGLQTITTDQYGSTYRLRETGRGNGIKTYNMKNAGLYYSFAADFEDADNSWNNVNTNKDQYATDAHWATEKTYDYYKNTFNRNSINNAGYPLLSYVHVDLIARGQPNNVNAFWDGSRMSYGDGGVVGTQTYMPLTTVDITGHEITHGVTSNTSNLNYSYESGAINEAFSDIFGTAIEFYVKPSTANWTIGEDMNVAIRSMSNPNLYNDPDTYHGTYWHTGGSDYGGVHTNSGVLNYWFYLLSMGGSGTNDDGNSYNLTGIGIEKAAAIAYRTNTVYLTSTSNYSKVKTYGIKSAEDLYGVGSAEALQTTCAFAAVGLGTCSSTPISNAPTALNTTGISETEATLNWTATNGASSYKVEYKTAAASTWTTASNATKETKLSLSGLNPATSYIWRVTANGASSTTSTTASSAFNTITATSVCQSSYDNSSNDTRFGAALTPFNTSVQGLIDPSGDKDYYKFVVSSGGSIVVKINGLPADYDLSIVNNRGVEVASSYQSGRAFEVINYTLTPGTYYARVVGHNGAYSATECYTLEIITGTADITDKNGITGETNNTMLEAYPNPTSDELNVHIPNNIAANGILTIVDLNGVIVLKQKANAANQKIDISKLTKGIYLLKVNDGENLQSVKIVKQ